MNDRRAFARLIDALRPWLDEVVVVGGWAHRLYRHHPAARSPSHLPLTTRDADIAFSAQQQPSGNIRESLLAADFREELRGEDHPPISRYVFGDGNVGFYAEFLTPLIGPTANRDRRPSDTIMAAGVTAQRLRYLDILMTGPWVVAIGAQNGYPLTKRAVVRIPNPSAFVGQKLVIHGFRTAAKRAQDILYIHDTLELFEHDLDMLRVTWSEMARRLSLGARTQLNQNRRTIFDGVTDAIRNAARIPADRTLRPDRVQTFCKHALDHIFDAS